MRRAALLLVLTLALSACGSSSTTPAESKDPTESNRECTVIEAKAWTFTDVLGDEPMWASGFTPLQAGHTKDSVIVRLPEPVTTSKTYRLDPQARTDGACADCVFGLGGKSVDSAESWLATSGTLTVTTGDKATHRLAATLDDVRLEQFTAGADGTAGPVQGGACLRLTHVVIDVPAEP